MSENRSLPQLYPAPGADAAPTLLSEGSLPSSTTGTEDAGARSAPADGAHNSRTSQRSTFTTLFSAVMLPMFMGAVDQTLLVTATPRIAAELGGLADTSWIAAAYLLAATITAPMYGRLGDRFGRRNVMLGALTVFVLGSIACAAAPTMELLIGARGLQGLGGGGLMVLSQALIGELVPPWERPRYQGYFALIFTTSSVGGPLIGGVVVHHGDWRWLFLANLPLGLIAFWRMSRLPRPVPSAARHAPYDPVGFTLFVLCAAATLLWFGQVGHRFPLVSPSSAGLVAVAGAAGAALARQQRRHPNAFLPLDILRLPGVRWICVSVLGFAATLFALLFLLPLYLQFAAHSSALDAGLQLLPLTFGIVIGSALNGRISARTGVSGQLPPWGLGAAAAGALALALLPPQPWLVTLAAAACGVGLGTVMPTAQLGTQILAGRERLGAAAALLSLTRSVGATLGTATFGGLAFILLPSTSGARDTLQVQGPAPAQVEHAFGMVFGTLAVFAAAAGIAAARAPIVALDEKTGPVRSGTNVPR
jgi:EmrB/QacA subfamily drug resistance transporter